MILFLDFDGVLHPDPCDEGERFSRLPAFEALMRDFPAVEIVVSSSWRVARTLDDLRAFFRDRHRSENYRRHAARLPGISGIGADYRARLFPADRD
ncbi:HAD domain-containing protein [Undibacterium arcticum]